MDSQPLASNQGQQGISGHAVMRKDHQIPCTVLSRSPRSSPRTSQRTLPLQWVLPASSAMYSSRRIVAQPASGRPRAPASRPPRFDTHTHTHTHVYTNS